MESKMNFAIVIAAALALAVPTFAADPNAPKIPDHWKKMGSVELVGLAKKLIEAEDGKTKRLLIEHIDLKYFADAKDTKAAESLTPAQWGQLVLSLKKELSDQTKAKWAAILQPVFTAKDMGQSEAPTAASTLTDLGRTDVMEFFAAWMAKHESWRSWGAAKLVEIFGRRWPGSIRARQSVHGKVADQVDSQYFTGADTIRAVDLRTWGRVIATLNSTFSSQRRLEWIRKFRSTFTSEPKTFAEMEPLDVKNLIDALIRLGNQGARDLAPAWVLATKKLTSSSLSHLETLTSLGLRGHDSDSKAARKRMAEHLTAMFRDRPGLITKAGDKRACSMVALLAEDAGAGTRAKWAAGLLAAFAPGDDGFRKLDVRRMSVLARAVSAADPKIGAELTLAWLDGKRSWAQVPIDVLATTVEKMGFVDAKRKAAFTMKLKATLVDKTLDWGTCLRMVEAYRRAGNHKKTREWVIRGYKVALGSPKARASVNSGQIFWIAYELYRNGLTGKGRGYGDYATAIAEMARKGTLGSTNPGGLGGPLVACDKYSFPWGSPLGDEASRQTLKNALTDSNCTPRLKLGKVIGWAYRATGELGPWCKYVDTQADNEHRGDAKAMWLLIKAHNEALIPREINTLRSLKALKDAFITAESQAVRLAAAHEFVCYHARRRSYKVALTFIESVKGQFDGSSSEALANWRDRILENQARRKAFLALRRAKRFQGARLGRLAYYRRKLAVARKAGNDEAMQLFQQKIKHIESEWNQ